MKVLDLLSCCNLFQEAVHELDRAEERVLIHLVRGEHLDHPVDHLGPEVGSDGVGLQEVFRVSGMRAVMGQDIVGVVGACVSRILSFEVDWFELDLGEGCCWDGGVGLCLGNLLVEIRQ